MRGKERDPINRVFSKLVVSGRKLQSLLLPDDKIEPSYIPLNLLKMNTTHPAKECSSIMSQRAATTSLTITRPEV